MPRTRARRRTSRPKPVVARAQLSDDSEREVCARFHQAIELIGRRWTGAILQILLKGPARFSVIKSALPEMTDRILSERLRELQAEGLLSRSAYPSVPVRVDYALTEKARDLTPMLEGLADWAHRWLPAPRAEQKHSHHR
ncbi:MAG: winged helix-turn-helix transcriptional regulator [Gemmatimonadaceae bacterium]